MPKKNSLLQAPGLNSWSTDIGAVCLSKECIKSDESEGPLTPTIWGDVDFSVQCDIVDESFKLEVTDQGKLMLMMSNLFDTSSIGLQIKINEYLAECTKSKLVFFIQDPDCYPEALITVIGTRVLDPELRISAETRIVKEPMNKNAPVVYRPGNDIDTRLSAIIDTILREIHGVEFHNLMMLPIIHPVPYEAVFTIGLVNFEEGNGRNRLCRCYVNEFLRFCLGAILNSFLHENERLHHERCRAVLGASEELFRNLVLNDGFYKTAADIACRLVDAESCSIFLINNSGVLVSQILGYTPGSNEEPTSGVLKITCEVGIIGHTMKWGEIYNCRNVMLDPFFNSIVDSYSNKQPRCMLSCPIMRKNKNLGLITVQNKTTSPFFSSEDEELLKAYSVYLPNAMFYAIDIWNKDEHLTKDSTIFNLQMTSKEQTKLDVEEEISFVQHCFDNHEFSPEMADLCSSNFILKNNIPERHTVCVCFDMFESTGMLKQLKISSSEFINFLVNVKHSYVNVPIHNWYHGLSTMHFIFVFLNCVHIVGIRDHYLSFSEAMALLLAALCHDVGHKETANPFQDGLGTNLAALYCSSGTIYQRYAYSQTLSLLSKEGCKIFSKVDKQTFKKLTTLIGNMIMATDVVEFLSKRSIYDKMIKEGYRKADPNHQQNLIAVLMTCACHSDYIQNWDHCRRQAIAACLDLFSKGNRCNVVDSPEESLERLRKIPEIVVHFINIAPFPAYRILSGIFAPTTTYLKEVEKNLEKWKEMKLMILKDPKFNPATREF